MESRKYKITWAYLIISACLVIYGKGPISEWLVQTAIVILAYSGANAAEHWAKRPIKGSKNEAE